MSRAPPWCVASGLSGSWVDVYDRTDPSRCSRGRCEPVACQQQPGRQPHPTPAAGSLQAASARSDSRGAAKQQPVERRGLQRTVQPSAPCRGDTAGDHRRPPTPHSLPTHPPCCRCPSPRPCAALAVPVWWCRLRPATCGPLVSSGQAASSWARSWRRLPPEHSAVKRIRRLPLLLRVGAPAPSLARSRACKPCASTCLPCPPAERCTAALPSLQASSPPLT